MGCRWAARDWFVVRASARIFARGERYGLKPALRTRTRYARLLICGHCCRAQLPPQDRVSIPGKGIISGGEDDDAWPDFALLLTDRSRPVRRDRSRTSDGRACSALRGAGDAPGQPR